MHRRFQFHNLSRNHRLGSRDPHYSAKFLMRISLRNGAVLHDVLAATTATVCPPTFCQPEIVESQDGLHTTTSRCIDGILVTLMGWLRIKPERTAPCRRQTSGWLLRWELSDGAVWRQPSSISSNVFGFALNSGWKWYHHFTRAGKSHLRPTLSRSRLIITLVVTDRYQTSEVDAQQEYPPSVKPTWSRVISQHSRAGVGRGCSACPVIYSQAPGTPEGNPPTTVFGNTTAILQSASWFRN